MYNILSFLYADKLLQVACDIVACAWSPVWHHSCQRWCMSAGLKCTGPAHSWTAQHSHSSSSWPFLHQNNWSISQCIHSHLEKIWWWPLPLSGQDDPLLPPYLKEQKTWNWLLVTQFPLMPGFLPQKIHHHPTVWFQEEIQSALAHLVKKT